MAGGGSLQGGSLLDSLGSKLNEVFGDDYQVNFAGVGGGSVYIPPSVRPTCGDPITPECKAEWDRFTNYAMTQAAIQGAAMTPYAAGVVGPAGLLKGWSVLDTALDAGNTLVTCAGPARDPVLCGENFLYAGLPGIGGWWDDVSDLWGSMKRGVGGVVDYLMGGGIRKGVGTLDASLVSTPADYASSYSYVSHDQLLRDKYGGKLTGGISNRGVYKSSDGVVTKFIKPGQENEINLLQNIGGRYGTPQFLGVVQEGGMVGYQMQYIDSVPTQLYRGRLTEDEIRRAVDDLLHIQQQGGGVIHGDLGFPGLGLHKDNVRFVTNPDGSTSVRFIDISGNPAPLAVQTLEAWVFEDNLRWFFGEGDYQPFFTMDDYLELDRNGFYQSMEDGASLFGVGGVSSITRQSVLIELSKANPVSDEMITARMVNDHVSSLGSADEYNTIAQVVNDILPPYASSNQELIAAGADRARTADEVMLCSTTWCRHNTKVTNEVLQERGEDVYQVFMRFSDSDGNQHSHVLSAVNKDGQWIYVDPTAGEAFYSTEAMTQTWLDQKGYNTLSIVATDLDTFEEVIIR